MTGDRQFVRAVAGWAQIASAKATQLRTWAGVTVGRNALIEGLPARSTPLRWSLRKRWTAAAVSVATFGVVVLLPAGAAATVDPCNPVVNPIECENTKPGSPDSEWDILGAGDDTIQGFATDISVNAGDTIRFKIKTTASSYRIDIYRLGWYGGAGARKVATVNPSVTLPQSQPACLTEPSTALYDCGNWAVSASWAVPAAAVSGVYIAKPTKTNGGASHIPFVVRNDASTSPLFFQTSDTTWQAYNLYGGADFYQGGNNGRAYKLSYNRPFATRGGIEARDWLFANEYPMIRFIERNGYDVSYTTGVDSDRRGSLIRNHKVFLSVGHDEYWSGPQRANVEAARDAGVHLAFFSGNEVYWKTRWEASRDGSNTAYRTLVCYKETWSNAKIDPSPEWTGTWRDPRFSPPANGGKPENGLTGTAYVANSVDLALQVPAEQGKFRLWRNTSVANLSAGQTASLAPHIVGYESNEDLDNGFRPAGLIRLSKTVGPTPEYLQDFGTVVAPGTTTHSLTMYRAASGALVFSAGTIQWAWGLDANHDGDGAAADSRMQQATVNLFADMGVQPSTLMTGLVAATASADTQAPTVSITSPAPNTTVTNGAAVTLQGTATDAGGRVAGVEVSTDGGNTWHPATGTTTWSYTFYTTGLGSQAVQVRAVDDSAQIGQAASLQVNLSGPNTLFGSRVPATPAVSDTSATELGVRFTPEIDGLITGVRFYKGSGNGGTHTGSLWSTNGVRLATGTFSNETATGWQTLTFGSPVNVYADVTYIASYYAPTGRYAAAPRFFSAGDHNAYPLVGLKSTASQGNGVFAYGAGFPTNSYEDTNYYVDVRFVASANAPPAVVSTTPLANATGVPVTTTVTATFSKAMNASSIQFTLKDAANVGVPGTTSYDSATKKATFTPSAALSNSATYTASVQGSDTGGVATETATTWSFTTQLDPTVVTLFATNAMPTEVAAADTNSVEVGMKFVASVNGQVVGLRFYQGPGNLGPHVGNLWTSTGTRLAQVTMAATSGSGWQYATFATPVTVTAGTTYVVSYFAPNGSYAADENYFATSVTNGPLTAPAGTNGVYRYGASSVFPNHSFHSTNYWVDPLFKATGGGPTPTPSPTSSPTPSPTPSPTGTPGPCQTVDPGTNSTIFPATATPANASWPDAAAIEVGVRFSSSTAGVVRGVRYYKGAQNTGTHTGSLWTVSGQLLATAVFANECATGWQTVLFSQPVAITAGTTYVASYHTTTGYYAADLNTFANGGLNAPPLSVPFRGAAYMYGDGAFPANESPHNYWVDVLFQASG